MKSFLLSKFDGIDVASLPFYSYLLMVRGCRTSCETMLQSVVGRDRNLEHPTGHGKSPLNYGRRYTPTQKFTGNVLVLYLFRVKTHEYIFP